MAMKDWRTEKALYHIQETSRRGTDDSYMVATGNEIAELCKAKNEMNGFINGCGGDRSYNCIAWLSTPYAV